MNIVKPETVNTKIINNFKSSQFYWYPAMVSKFVLVIILACVCVGLRAQDSAIVAQPTFSMLPNVSYPDIDKLVEAAKQNYPRVKMFQHRIDAANMNLKKSKLGWYDLFTFSFLYSPNNSTTLVNPSILNGYQFGIFFNFGSLLQKPALIKQAKEEKAVTEYELQEYYVNLATLVRQRYFVYIQQVTLLKLQYQAELDAESNMEMSKHKFERGEMTLDDYNKALSNYNEHTQSKIQSEGALLVAKASLEELVGKKIEDVK